MYVYLINFLFFNFWDWEREFLGAILCECDYKCFTFRVFSPHHVQIYIFHEHSRFVDFRTRFKT